MPKGHFLHENKVECTREESITIVERPRTSVGQGFCYFTGLPGVSRMRIFWNIRDLVEEYNHQGQDRHNFHSGKQHQNVSWGLDVQRSMAMAKQAWSETDRQRLRVLLDFCNQKRSKVDAKKLMQPIVMENHKLLPCLLTRVSAQVQSPWSLWRMMLQCHHLSIYNNYSPILAQRDIWKVMPRSF